MAPMRFPHEPGLEQQAHLSEFCQGGLESFAESAVLDFSSSLRPKRRAGSTPLQGAGEL